MVAPLSRRWLDLRRLTEFGFGRLLTVCFLGFLGLYVVYGAFVFARLAVDLPLGERAIMVLGPSTIAISFLMSPALFAASAIRFDLLTAREPAVRRLYWGQMALAGLAAYSLAAVGPLAVRSLLPGATDPLPESFSPFPEAVVGLRMFLPISCGLFAVVSGVAGALAGRMSARSVWNGARAALWFACLGLMGTFWALFRSTGYQILQDGDSPVWIMLTPLALPVVLTGTLAWRELGPPTRPRFRKTAKSNPPDSDWLDQGRLGADDEHRATEVASGVDATAGGEDAASIARRIRSLVGSRAELSQTQIAEIVEALSEHEQAPYGRGVRKSIVRPNILGDFCSAWTCLSAGSLIVASLAGMLTSISAALMAGFVGSAGVAMTLRSHAGETTAGSMPA